jgi:DNA polymerase-1
MDELPPEFESLRKSGDKLFPSLLFPWVEPDGTVRNQIKIPAELAEQMDAKYLWAKGAPARLGVMRNAPGAGSALIVEGTKQSIVAGEYAPPEWSVYGIGGCRLWYDDGMPTPHLAVFENKTVYVMLDADAGSNPDVYEAGEKLREALTFFGAEEIRFTRLPAAGKNGLDDLMGRLDPDKRKGRMQSLIDATAKLSTAKSKRPADSKPSPKEKKPQKLEEKSEDGRYHVVVNGDAQKELRGILDGVKAKWDGRKVFNFGGVVSRLKDGKTIPQSKNMWKSTIAEACALMGVDNNGQYYSTHPSGYGVDASYARAEDFTPLKGVKHAPFVREDGTVCYEQGYDKGSQMFLHLSEDLKGVSIPDNPTDDEVREAREVLEDWLFDFRQNVPSDADRANMLGLAITPFVRLLLPSCPLAVINGLQMGVGKNLLADGISIVYNGDRMAPLSLVLDEDEQRKQLTSTFREGRDFFLFDEAHQISGKELAKALTANTWSDRQLGQSLQVEYPNQATWIALGNNVTVEGDIQRRVYPINLRPNVPNPHLRKDTDFRHPNFLEFTRTNRKKILTAMLTLVRAWFAAGKPHPEHATGFGSFEVFERTIGGILENAGIYGFLTNRTDFANESSYEMQHWEQHLSWLHGVFGDDEFSTRQVRDAIAKDPGEAETPPGMEDTSAKNYTRQLGKAYGRMRDRFIGGYRLVKASSKNHTTMWIVEDIGGNDNGFHSPDDDGGGNGGGSDSDPGPVADGSAPSWDASYAVPFDDSVTGSVDQIDVFDVLGAFKETPEVPEDDEPEGVIDPFAPEDPDELEVYQQVQEYRELVWDIETCDADELFRSEKGSFLTLSGYQGDDDENVITEDGNEMVAAVEKADRNFGWNQLAFDIPALAKHHDGDYLKMSEGAVDLMLVERQINPTDAKGVKPGYYGLDQTAKRYGHDGKTDDVKKLATKHGGYDQIPRDELEPYLHGDLDATAFLKDKIGHHYDEDPYIQREHEVQRRVTFGPRMHGFRVDTDELERRLAEGEERKKSNLRRLNEEYGMPLGKWTTYKRKENYFEEFASPLASKPGKEWLEHIFKDLGAPVMRRTEKSKDISTGKDDLRAAIDFYSDPQKLRRAKIDPSKVQLDKITDLCELIMSVTGERTVYQTIDTYRVGDRVYPQISPEQASGRWSVTKPGLTVLGKRGGKHYERGVLLADPGHRLVAVDLDQVDARAIAAHSGDERYMELFLPGMDLHSTNAERAFGRSDGEWRDRAKILGHGFNYGMGPKGAAAQTGMDLKIAETFHQMMQETYPRLEEWKNEIRHQAEVGMLLDNGFGRKMKCSPDRAYTQAPALVGQGATRDIIAKGILRLPMEVVAMMKVIVHDEIVFSIPEDRYDETIEVILDAMQFEIQFNNNPPMQVTAGVSKPGLSWADVYEK